MKKLYIIAHSDKSGTPEIFTCYSNEKAVSHVSEIVDPKFTIKPYPTTLLSDYVSDYYTWIREENDNICNVTLDFKIIEI